MSSVERDDEDAPVRVTPAPGAVRALVVDDEPLLRTHLAHHLAQLWPELEIAGEARNGREAVDLVEQLRPDVVFLDVHMPGMNGVEAARLMGPDVQIVFVTAYEQYAVAAFEQGAIDYLVKPFDADRLGESVARLRRRIAERRRADAADAGLGQVTSLAGDVAEAGGPLSRLPANDLDAVLSALAGELRRRAPAGDRLQWIRASVGQMIKLIPVDEVLYFRSDEKYTLVVWVGGEALIRKSIRELLDGLEPETFIQIHRSTIVNLRFVSQVIKGPNETAEVHLKGRNETLSVSRNHVHWFRQY
ncbi:LytR/AlgR family response regulator transcription factor [Scleromatobacter humisilvae]|uniref:LytTR family DNA-binding domain-containing protein n=1 Tax=Scleromatobacter humisilvae TaxID=2897159 RepID=A0A9X1YE00_9BURK|nr:LytTR family DNA-binding domain-containing protein [Scleromatobacter humisilvae]MCK9684188.1 LytTR family DNA-binding domain-containing protein [Scleromatobacter humisilvae]